MSHLILLRRCPASLASLEGHEYLLPSRQKVFTAEDWQEEALVSVDFGPTGRREKTANGDRAEIYEPILAPKSRARQGKDQQAGIHPRPSISAGGQGAHRPARATPQGDPGPGIGAQERMEESIHPRTSTPRGQVGVGQPLVRIDATPAPSGSRVKDH